MESPRELLGCEELKSVHLIGSCLVLLLLNVSCMAGNKLVTLLQ